MAERRFTCPVPRIEQLPETMKPATLRLERVALRWRDLAERRRDHFLDLYQTGRWRRYCTYEKFMQDMRQAIVIADRWAAIAPEPEELVPEEALVDTALAPLEFDRPDDLAA